MSPNEQQAGEEEELEEISAGFVYRTHARVGTDCMAKASVTAAQCLEISISRASLPSQLLYPWGGWGWMEIAESDTAEMIGGWRMWESDWVWEIAEDEQILLSANYLAMQFAHLLLTLFGDLRKRRGHFVLLLMWRYYHRGGGLIFIAKRER